MKRPVRAKERTLRALERFSTAMLSALGYLPAAGLVLAAAVQPARNKARASAAQHPAARMRVQRLVFIADDLLAAPGGGDGAFFV